MMTVMLLFLMAYSLIGEALHEWLGIGMLLLFVLHHILNASWYRNLRRGAVLGLPYTPDGARCAAIAYDACSND